MCARKQNLMAHPFVIRFTRQAFNRVYADYASRERGLTPEIRMTVTGL